MAATVGYQPTKRGDDCGKRSVSVKCSVISPNQMLVARAIGFWLEQFIDYDMTSEHLPWPGQASNPIK